MTRSAGSANERGWIWLLRGVGGLFALFVIVNLVDVGSALVTTISAAAMPAAPTVDDRGVVDVPGAYHVACVESRPTMTARVSNAVQQMLPARLIAAEELPNCQRCGERIDRGSQIWVASPN